MNVNLLLIIMFKRCIITVVRECQMFILILLLRNVYNWNVRAYVDQLSDSDIEIMKGRSIVGCDPGKFSIVYMSDGTSNTSSASI